MAATTFAGSVAATLGSISAVEGRSRRDWIPVFDCIARRGVLDAGITTEVARLRERLGGAPVCGFYTYGEIARTAGVNGFHNQTLVVVAFG